MTYRAFSCAFLAALLAVVPPVAAIDWPDVPVPAGATGETVSSHMVYNGMSMRASRFTVNSPVEEVKAFYRKHWDGKVVDSPLGPYKSVLGHLHRNRYYITVELAAAGASTQGQIGVMLLPDKDLPADAVGKGFERLPRTSVAEDVVHMDTGRRVRTLGMVNDYSPFQNEQFYTRRLTAQGYAKDAGADACMPMSAACHSRYTRNDDRITVTSMRESAGTYIVAVVE